VVAAVEGFANYVAMVNPEKGTPLQARARALVEKHGKHPQPKPRRLAPEAKPEAALAGDAVSGTTPDAVVAKKPWWKLW
jgi:hypothetical protein